MNLESFPQDVQMCNFTVASYAHSSSDLRTIPLGDTGQPGGLARTSSALLNANISNIPGLDLQNFQQRDTHKIREVLVKSSSFFYDSVAAPWKQIDYTFVIARESFTYINTIAWPLVIVTAIAVLSPMYHPGMFHIIEITMTMFSKRFTPSRLINPLLSSL